MEESIKKIVQNLELHEKIELDDIPEIDLYMDQVIQLFESKLSGYKRTVDDKVMTKTMINNYAKGKLLMSIKNKKYSKEHLILMSLIYSLKGPLSISDIKTSLDNIVEKFETEGEYPLRELYECYLTEYDKDADEFEVVIEEKIKSIEESLENKNNINSDYEKKFLLLCSLVNMSNMYRRLSEKVIDEFFSK